MSTCLVQVFFRYYIVNEDYLNVDELLKVIYTLKRRR